MYNKYIHKKKKSKCLDYYFISLLLLFGGLVLHRRPAGRQINKSVEQLVCPQHAHPFVIRHSKKRRDQKDKETSAGYISVCLYSICLYYVAFDCVVTRDKKKGFSHGLLPTHDGRLWGWVFNLSHKTCVTRKI